jgi:hypothetical protein
MDGNSLHIPLKPNVNGEQTMPSAKSTRSSGRRTTQGKKTRARKATTLTTAEKKANQALHGVVRNGAAGAREAVAVVRGAAGSIVRAGLHEMNTAAQATRDALRRFLASTERVTRSTARTLRETARDTAGAARRAARKSQRNVKAGAVNTLTSAVGKTARAARQQVRSMLG